MKIVGTAKKVSPTPPYTTSVNRRPIFNFVTARFSSRFAAKRLYRIPPHLICVATLPCGTLMSHKKLSYRRGTARRAVSFETVRIVAQMFVELYLISPHQANDLQGHPESLEMA